MNNYLSNLVGKVLNQIPLAKPHRASLFAPRPYASSGALGNAGTTTFGNRFWHDEEDAASLDAHQNESPQLNLRLARTAPPDDEGAGSPRLRAGASEEGRERRVGESQEGFFAEPSPALLAPPAKQPRPASPQTQSPISSMPREANDEADQVATRRASSTQADSEAAQKRMRLETLRPKAEADAHHVAARETGAALARLRERLSRDERDTRQLEGELRDTRRDVRRLDADASQRNMPQARPVFASEGDPRPQSIREGLREEADALQSKPGATQAGSRRAPQLKPVRSEMISPRRNIIEEVKSNAPAPTIQVTIGRIEVRGAAAPSASSRVQRAAAPQLSLEDYLRQRNGGGR